MTNQGRFSRPGRRGFFLSLLTVALLLGWADAAKAESGSASFQAANLAFAQGHYREAVARFEELGNTRGWSAPLLYNLANAYQRNGSVGRAVLNYQRAQLLAPSDPDIAANLAFVRTSAGLPSPPAHFYQTVTRRLSPTAFTWLAGAGLWLAAVALVVAGRKRHLRPYLYPAALAAFLMAVPAATAAGFLDRACEEAVVVAPKSVPLRLAPFDTSAVEATVSEGDTVTVLTTHEDFMRVRDGQGHTGWIQSAQVLPIVPRPV